jgi:hypothetical protein
LTRPAVVSEVRNGAEVGARRVSAGAEVVLARRWERLGRPYCRGLVREPGRSFEFVAPVWRIEEATA